MPTKRTNAAPSSEHLLLENRALRDHVRHLEQTITELQGHRGNIEVIKRLRLHDYLHGISDGVREGSSSRRGAEILFREVEATLPDRIQKISIDDCETIVLAWAGEGSKKKWPATRDFFRRLGFTVASPDSMKQEFSRRHR